jgi:LCP family protein required for cell wall assembly
MILCTFNKQDKTLTMTSFMRDLYVKIPGWGSNKLNSAYFLGGMPLLRETLLLNFGVHVDAFVEVDFSGFRKAVETLGGVDIKLTAEEAAYMNKNYDNKKTEDNWPLKEGKNHLSGAQALFYSRIRAIGMDFERTERQRKVMTALLNCIKNIGIDDALALANALLPMISTDMTNQEITSYLLSLLPVVTSGNIQNQRIPADGTYEMNYVGSLDVVLPDYAANRQYLLDTLMPR